MKYALDTDFSSLNGPKAANWIMGFQDMAEDAFADSSHLRLLGNLGPIDITDQIEKANRKGKKKHG